MVINYLTYRSPLGLLRILANKKGICKLAITQEDWQQYQRQLGKVEEVSALDYPIVEQLDEYFRKERKSFDLPLALEGSPFYQGVWQELQAIPYGQVKSYGEIAEAVGKPKAARAIGQANRANPLPIIIPCHRVIGKNGKLVGYAGSRTDIKEFLLRLEGFID